MLMRDPLFSLLQLHAACIVAAVGRLRDFCVDDAKERVEAAVNLSGRDKFVAVPMKASLEDVGAEGCLPTAIPASSRSHASQSS